tara:strand:+ start:6638 stop:6823 length:186 start_codon:yes stop_codon:yes gene_type:complete
MIPTALIKLIVPKVLDMVIKQFKMDKVMDYVFQENELDDKVKDLQDEIDYLKARIINLEKE